MIRLEWEKRAERGSLFLCENCGKGAAVRMAKPMVNKRKVGDAICAGERKMKNTGKGGEELATQQELENLNNATKALRAEETQLLIEIEELRKAERQYAKEAGELEVAANTKNASADEINSKITDLRSYVGTTVTSQTKMVNDKTAEARTATETIVKQKADSVLQQTTTMISQAKNELNTRLDNEVKWLHNRIGVEVNALNKKLDTEVRAINRRISEVRNPFTGKKNSFEELLESLFDLHRPEPLTAAEYDKLDLPAAAYDAYAVTAIDYTLYAKMLLQVWSEGVLTLTAQEYDNLRLAAEAFERYGLNCMEYDLLGKKMLG